MLKFALHVIFSLLCEACYEKSRLHLPTSVPPLTHKLTAPHFYFFLSYMSMLNLFSNILQYFWKTKTQKKILAAYLEISFRSNVLSFWPLKRQYFKNWRDNFWSALIWQVLTVKVVFCWSMSVVGKLEEFRGNFGITRGWRIWGLQYY